MKTIKIFITLSILFLIGCNSSIVDDPATTIRFLVPELSHVKLTVENSYATVITTLVDEERQAGVYEESFDNSNLAEGIYFYTLELSNEIGNYSKSTIHFLLIK
jgi:hypothetical protein